MGREGKGRARGYKQLHISTVTQERCTSEHLSTLLNHPQHQAASQPSPMWANPNPHHVPPEKRGQSQQLWPLDPKSRVNSDKKHNYVSTSPQGAGHDTSFAQHL